MPTSVPWPSDNMVSHGRIGPQEAMRLDVAVTGGHRVGCEKRVITNLRMVANMTPAPQHNIVPNRCEQLDRDVF